MKVWRPLHGLQRTVKGKGTGNLRTVRAETAGVGGCRFGCSVRPAAWWCRAALAGVSVEGEVQCWRIESSACLASSVHLCRHAQPTSSLETLYRTPQQHIPDRHPPILPCALTQLVAAPLVLARYCRYISYPPAARRCNSPEASLHPVHEPTCSAARA